MGTDNKEAKSLNGLIEILPEKPKNLHSNVQIIIWDIKGEEIIHETSYNPFKKFRYFAIHHRGTLRNLKIPDIAINYGDAPEPFKISISCDIRIELKGAFKLVRAIGNAESPYLFLTDMISEAVEAYIFQHQDFVPNFKSHREKLASELTHIGSEAGLAIELRIRRGGYDDQPKAPEFLQCNHGVTVKTGDGQAVEIKHDLALTLRDDILYSLSGITDLTVWAKSKLDQFTNNAVIEMTYADILLSMDQTNIKIPMKNAAFNIGYDLKQLISAPGLDNEKFYFETADESIYSQKDYSTKDAKFKLAINVIVHGRLKLRDEKTRIHIRPGQDIISDMKKLVVNHVRISVNSKTPDECFLQLSQLEIDLIDATRKELEASYGFNDLNIDIKILETDLSRRFDLLQARPYLVQLLADFNERNFDLWFQVRRVTPDGWFRFRANNGYNDTSEELEAIGRLVANSMNAAMSRRGSDINGKFILSEFKKAALRVEQEFGLEIGLHDFSEGFSEEENYFIRNRQKELEEDAARRDFLRSSRTKELAGLEDQRRVAAITGDSDEMIKQIDEKIDRINNKSSLNKEKFVSRSQGNDFLLPGKSPDKFEETSTTDK